MTVHPRVEVGRAAQRRHQRRPGHRGRIGRRADRLTLETIVGQPVGFAGEAPVPGGSQRVTVAPQHAGSYTPAGVEAGARLSGAQC